MTSHLFPENLEFSLSNVIECLYFLPRLESKYQYIPEIIKKLVNTVFINFNSFCREIFNLSVTGLKSTTVQYKACKLGIVIFARRSVGVDVYKFLKNDSSVFKTTNNKRKTN